MESVQPVRARISGAPDPVDVLNSDIQNLEADLQKNPQNAARDQEAIAIDQQEMALEKEMDQLFFSGDSSGKYDQLQEQLLLLEKSREDKTGKTLLETPEQLNHALLAEMVANIREKDPHFAPMGTEEGSEALAALQQLIDQM